MGSGMAQGNRMKVCAPIAEAFRGGHRCGNPVEPSNRRGLMAECRPILGIDRLHAFALPDEAHEALRHLARARDAAVEDLRRKRQSVTPLMLRHGRLFPGTTTW